MVEGENFIFIHVPKTGGSAITEALGGRAKRHLHMPASQIENRAGRLVFAFVRNPWDRTVSEYYYELTKAQSAAHSLTFREWAVVHTRSQMFWLAGCDMVGRFEYLDRDFERIKEKIGFEAKPLKRINATPHPAYRLVHDAETKAHVAWTCAAEIRRFGYTF